MQETYLEQFKRVQRWYQRVNNIAQGKVHNKSSDYLKDEVLAFFINCFHLKDWIRNDDSIPQKVRNQVENFVKASPELTLCRELCHSTKHLKLTNKQLSERKLNRQDIKLKLGSGSPMITMYFWIETDNEECRADELAKECVDQWINFLEDNNLLPN